MKNHRLIAIILLLCMLVSLTGCMPSNLNQTEPENPTTTVPATTVPPTTTTGATDEELEACMAILLMHETAHTMGLEEQYEDPDHDKNGWVCVMEEFESMANMNMDSNTDNKEGRDLLQFYHGIKNGTIDAFCDSCKTQLSECVDTSYTNALD